MKKILFLLCIIFIGCDKEEGEGGTSSIEGRVIYFTTTYNTLTQVNDTHFYPKAGKDVYIIYSNDQNQIYDDKFETDWDGRYYFDYLRKGEYTIYTHVDSIVVNDINYDFPIFQSINIDANNSSNIVPNFVIQR